MPTLFIFFGMRFFFYSNEHLPIHVHVKNGDGEAKFEVENIRMIFNIGNEKQGFKISRSYNLGKSEYYHF